MIRSLPNHIARRKGGFTLVELSIVLVIIALIIGGVLVGKDLIAASQVRAQISQIEKYSAAVNTFKLKYGYLPGDIPDPAAQGFGFAQRAAGAGGGDGNGLIFGRSCCGTYPEAQGSGETVMFWQDLSDANLIDGYFHKATLTATNPAVDITGAAIDLYLPRAKIGRGGYVYVWNGGPWVGSGWGNDGHNYFGVTAITDITTGGGQFNSSPNITVGEAYAIDTKIDDGLPEYGTVLAIYFNVAVNWPTLWAARGSSSTATVGIAGMGTPQTTSCMDGLGGTIKHYTLKVGTASNADQVNCALSFRMQ